jgi:hypothetical protein
MKPVFRFLGPKINKEDENFFMVSDFQPKNLNTNDKNIHNNIKIQSDFKNNTHLANLAQTIKILGAKIICFDGCDFPSKAKILLGIPSVETIPKIYADKIIIRDSLTYNSEGFDDYIEFLIDLKYNWIKAIDITISIIYPTLPNIFKKCYHIRDITIKVRDDYNHHSTINNDYLNKITQYRDRNIKGYKKCQSATLATLYLFHTYFVKDVFIMIAKIIWNERYDQVWYL